MIANSNPSYPMDNLSFEDLKTLYRSGNSCGYGVLFSPYFQTIVKYLFLTSISESYKKEFLKISTVNEFQVKVMNQFIGSIIRTLLLPSISVARVFR